MNFKRVSIIPKKMNIIILCRWRWWCFCCCCRSIHINHLFLKAISHRCVGRIKSFELFSHKKNINIYINVCFFPLSFARSITLDFHNGISFNIFIYYMLWNISWIKDVKQMKEKKNWKRKWAITAITTTHSTRISSAETVRRHKTNAIEHYLNHKIIQKKATLIHLFTSQCDDQIVSRNINNAMERNGVATVCIYFRTMSFVR